MNLAIYRELESVVESCSRPNWDGLKADPIRTHVVQMVAFYLGGLPAYIPAPTILPDCEGRLMLIWRDDHEKLCLVFHPDELITWLIFNNANAKVYEHGSYKFGEPHAIEVVKFFTIWKEITAC